MLSGAAALAIGTVLLGLAFSGAPGASATQQQVPCGSTPFVPESVGSLGLTTVIATDTPIPTCTPVRLKTHTPTTTPTEAATATPVPVTPAPSNTAVPATATQPGGGAGGQEVRPPDTGTGAMAGGSGIELPFLAAGMLLLVLGSGSMLVGARRRS